MSWTELGLLDVGYPCSRCQTPIIEARDLGDGRALRVPLLAGGWTTYRWCARCQRRRRERAKKFGVR